MIEEKREALSNVFYLNEENVITKKKSLLKKKKMYNLDEKS